MAPYTFVEVPMLVGIDQRAVQVEYVALLLVDESVSGESLGAVVLEVGMRHEVMQ